MVPFGGWNLQVILLSLLYCQGSGEEPFEVNISPEQVVVEAGGSVKINCSTTCAQPSSGGLETPLDKIVVKDETQWKVYLVSNATQDATIHCHFTCSNKQISKYLNVQVFHIPKEIQLSLKPSSVTVGSSFTLECWVYAVAPLECLTLTLLRGKESLYNQTFLNTTAGPHNVTVTHNTIAHLEDGRHNFSCQAELDLRLLGNVIRRVSSPQKLEVHEIIQDKQMVIIITVVTVLLFLFVTSVLLCFAFGQHWRQQRTGAYRVQAAWRNLRWPSRAQSR